MTSNLTLFGTNQPPPAIRSFSLGELSFSLQDGGLRHVKLNGVEAIRGIAFLVRDRDWGTLTPLITNEKINQTDSSLCISYDARFDSQGAQLDIAISIDVNADGLAVAAKGIAVGSFETNRTGFTVLHPIEGVAGCAVRVDHSKGPPEVSSFPALIDPWQPFMDITALTHQVGGNSVTCTFTGDTFEMEDQRQWGDASYKTYNRPLSKPWPYKIEDREVIEQSVELRWTKVKTVAVATAQEQGVRAVFPQLALVITPHDALTLASTPHDLKRVNPQRLLCHLDATLGDTAKQFSAFAKAQQTCDDTAFDLELVCRCEPDPQPELVTLAAQMAASGFEPSSILVCPSVDRQSTPPGSDWPDCPPLDVVYSAAAGAFPAAIIGGGMVSLFTELNRKRPPVDSLDFVSHGLCPIVHAADDLSVMETLEAIPYITKSAQAIIGNRDYRIGPAPLAMRQNPYGERTIPNPDNKRLCMTNDDPRHRAEFGSAYVIGLATALAPAGVSVWTPAALYGPRGVVAGNKNFPITAALKQLAGIAGHPVHSAERVDGIARLCVGDIELIANLTARDHSGLGPFEWKATERKN